MSKEKGGITCAIELDGKEDVSAYQAQGFHRNFGHWKTLPNGDGLTVEAAQVLARSFGFGRPSEDCQYSKFRVIKIISELA